MQNITMSVQGMKCNHCVITISAALYKLGAAATVDLSAGTVSVQYDENKFIPESLVHVIEELGYDVSGIKG